MELMTIDEAAAACGVSRDTIKRRLRDGAFPGAERGQPHGRRAAPWLIPVGDLTDAGLLPVLAGSPSVPCDPDALLGEVRAQHLHDMRIELRRLHETVRSLAAALAAVAVGGDCAGCNTADRSRSLGKTAKPEYRELK